MDSIKAQRTQVAAGSTNVTVHPASDTARISDVAVHTRQALARQKRQTPFPGRQIDRWCAKCLMAEKVGAASSYLKPTRLSCTVQCSGGSYTDARRSPVCALRGEFDGIVQYLTQRRAQQRGVGLHVEHGWVPVSSAPCVGLADPRCARAHSPAHPAPCPAPRAAVDARGV